MDPTRFDAYVARTQNALDWVALATIWLMFMPFVRTGSRGAESIVLLVLRVALSALFATDLTIRSHLSGQRWRYPLRHPVAVLAVVLPAARVLFSLRLIRTLFRRGAFARFLLAATALTLNGALLVYYIERHSPGASILTPGDALWWSFVTATTVGYGDVVPVTDAGRTIAVLLMFLAVSVFAVVTAQLADRFARERPDQGPDADSAPDSLAARLERIEALLRERGDAAGEAR